MSSQRKQRRVLVTGGSGFLGSWVTHELRQRGHRVRVLSRRPPPTRAGVEHVAADIADGALVTKAVRGCDAVIHVAGMVSLLPIDREMLHRVNVEGTRNVLQAALDAGVRVVHTSSIATLGYTEIPTSQDETATLRHDDRAHYPYAQSKWLAERLAVQFAQNGCDVVTVNPGYLLGPGDNEPTSTRIILQYLRGGVWFFPPGGISFADVRDVAAATVNALGSGNPGERYALGGENLSYGDLFAALQRVTGGRRPQPAPRAAGLIGAFAAQLAAVFLAHPFRDFNLVSWRYACRYNYCDSSKARSALAYASRNIEETLRDTVRYQLARGLVEPVTLELALLAASAKV